MNLPDMLTFNEADALPGGAGAVHGSGQRLIVNNPKLKRQQRIHAIGIAFMGSAGLTAALVLHCCVQPVSAVAVALFFLFFFLSGSGITIGHHRYFAHRSFRASKAVKVMLAFLGSTNGQGPVVYWVAVHRMHHMHADRKGDPHSPNLHGPGFMNRLRGALHAFIGWTVSHDVPNTNVFSRDLLSDKTIMWISQRYYWWLLAGWALPAILGGIFTGTAYGALEGFLWGGLVRMLAVNSSLYAVAVAGHAHRAGSREFPTNDRSTNSMWLAIPTMGDSWHHNHHAFPRAAIISLHWWQLDISGLVVSAMEKIGIVSDVCRITAEEMRAERPSRPES